MLRLEFAIPGYVLFSVVQYNSIITIHGLLMIFYMIMPILIGGFGNVLFPLMINSSDMIFPRMNLLSFDLLMFSFSLLILSFSSLNFGWTFYVPLSLLSTSFTSDFVFFSLFIAGFSSLFGSYNFITSLFKCSNLSIISSSLFLPLFP